MIFVSVTELTLTLTPTLTLNIPKNNSGELTDKHQNFDCSVNTRLGILWAVASIPPRSSGAIPPIRIPHVFLPPHPPSFPFPLLFLSIPCPFPFLASCPVEFGHWIQPRKNLANLDVRTCLLMYIVYVENSH